MKRHLAFLLLIGLLPGCALLETLVPGGPTLADGMWSGVKSAEPESILGAIDPRAAAGAVILEALGQGDPLGTLLPLTMLGETEPRWVLCTGELVAKCRDIPLHAKVHVVGNPIGRGSVWRPSKLTADDFNDKGGLK